MVFLGVLEMGGRRFWEKAKRVLLDILLCTVK